MKHFILIAIMMLYGSNSFALSYAKKDLKKIADSDPSLADKLENFDNYLAGNWVVGNGGDPLRDIFFSAKKHASHIVINIKPQSLSKSLPENVKKWIVKNKEDLSSDILASKHKWIMEAKPTCAWTTRPKPTDKVPFAATIQLSFQTCSTTVNNFFNATKLLIHESVHHFDLGEEMADQVSWAIANAWREGTIEWLPMTQSNVPAPREKHSAVWTGKEMIIFGGKNASTALNSAHAYNPDKDTWRDITTPNLKPRYNHTAIWALNKMIVWGGYIKQNDTSSWQYDGVIYDPKADSWEKLTPPWDWQEAPNNSFNENPRQTALWTGTELIIFGGSTKTRESLGAIFNPKTKKWKEISKVGAPLRLAGQTAIWTSDKMIIWGGYKGINNFDREITNEGAIYDPKTDTWETITTINAPKARANHVAVWTGKEMVIFGGGGVSSSGKLSSTGGIYNPKGNNGNGSWVELKSELAVDRLGHTAIWNGEEMLVIGGKSFRYSTYYKDIIAINPELERFRGISSKSSPEARWNHTAVFTGHSMIVWGGAKSRSNYINSGGIFYP